MNLINNKFVKVAIIASLIFSVTFTLAATMTITGVGILGGSEATITSPNVDDVDWVLTKVAGKWRVTGVSLSFDADLTAGIIIYIDLLDNLDAMISSGSETLASDLLASANTMVTVTPDVLATDIDKIAIFVVG